jgi:hypothetical protein
MFASNPHGYSAPQNNAPSTGFPPNQYAAPLQNQLGAHPPQGGHSPIPSPRLSPAPYQGHHRTQSLNQFQKPATVTFKFVQKRFDKSGTIEDQNGKVIYKIKDEGEDHTFGFAKSYPMIITRASDGSQAAKIEWHDKPKKTHVEGLGGKGKQLLDGEVMNAE